MTTEERQDTERSHRATAVPSMPLTSEVLTHLQVCVSSVELLAGMSLPAELFQAVGRLARAVDGLVAAAEEARRPCAANEDGLSVGLDVPPG
jgi:hypothetical protein